VSHWFDTAAVEAAERGPGVTRREGLRRTAAMVLAGSPLAALAGAGFPRIASAQGTEECLRCLNFASRGYASGYATCAKAWVKGHAVGGIGGMFTLFCVEANVASFQVHLVRCFTGPCGSPPPEKGNYCPPPPNCTQVPAPPPVIPPGGPSVDQCNNCLSVGGKCCYSAGELCACANPTLDCCQRYGCC
jgi:hypothetical protein